MGPIHHQNRWCEYAGPLPALPAGSDCGNVGGRMAASRLLLCAFSRGRMLPSRLRLPRGPVPMTAILLRRPAALGDTDEPVAFCGAAQ